MVWQHSCRAMWCAKCNNDPFTTTWMWADGHFHRILITMIKSFTWYWRTMKQLIGITCCQRTHNLYELQFWYSDNIAHISFQIIYFTWVLCWCCCPNSTIPLMIILIYVYTHAIRRILTMLVTIPMRWILLALSLSQCSIQSFILWFFETYFMNTWRSPRSNLLKTTIL